MMEDKCAASAAIRQARARVKSGVRAGNVTVGEVVLGGSDLWANTRLADVVDWGWPRLGPVRQVRVGHRAARDGLNLLLPIGKASRATRLSFVEIVGGVLGEPMARASAVQEEEARNDEVERLSWLLQKAERDRDAAIAAVAEFERTASVHQVMMPTLDAERMLADLADAVEVHRRTVTSKTSPPDKWANADEELWRRKNEILAGDPPKLQAVA